MEQYRRHRIINGQNSSQTAIQRQSERIVCHPADRDAARCHKPFIAQQNLQAANLTAYTAVIPQHAVCGERRTISRAHFFRQHIAQRRTLCQRRRIGKRRCIVQVAVQFQANQHHRAIGEQILIGQHNRLCRRQLIRTFIAVGGRTAVRQTARRTLPRHDGCAEQCNLTGAGHRRRKHINQAAGITR